MRRELGTDGSARHSSLAKTRRAHVTARGTFGGGEVDRIGRPERLVGRSTSRCTEESATHCPRRPAAAAAPTARPRGRRLPSTTAKRTTVLSRPLDDAATEPVTASTRTAGDSIRAAPCVEGRGTDGARNSGSVTTRLFPDIAQLAADRDSKRRGMG